MYSVVLMMALTQGAETPDRCFGNKGCSDCGGCYSDCGGRRGLFGGGLFGGRKNKHGCNGCYSNGCYSSGYGCYSSGYGCYSSGYGCYSGGYNGGYGCYASGYGSGYGCYASGYGSAYGSGCYASGYGSAYGSGCYASGYGSAYGSGCYASGSVYPGAYGGCSTGVIVPSGGVIMPATGGEQPPAKGNEPKQEGGKVGPPNAATAPATLVVTLPEDAKLTIDGNPTTSTSSRRVFVTPELAVGTVYFYNLRAEVVREGKTVVMEERVQIRPGQESTITLQAPTSVAAR